MIWLGAKVGFRHVYLGKERLFTRVCGIAGIPEAPGLDTPETVLHGTCFYLFELDF